jgi:hypothetical protein
LKQAFTSAPILVHVDLDKPFIIEADASDFSLGSILSQIVDNNKLHQVGFHSRKFELAEIKYEIHDRELLEILDSFKQWRHVLERSPHQIIVYNDHCHILQNALALTRR